jgi:sulfatase maturation enzyme AslB (radical SAM superfamily)
MSLPSTLPPPQRIVTIEEQPALSSAASEKQTSPGLFSKLVCRTFGGALTAARRGFPAVVRIETTNACNARCIICPHRTMLRPIVTMDESLYADLIDQCAAAKCREVHLHNFGEPLLDKRLEDRIAYAKQNGIRCVKIFCNGSLLTPERGKRLIEAGLDELKVSFDGATREEFERIRTPLCFDAVVRNIVELVKIRNAAQAKLRIHVACCSTTDKHATMRSLESVVDAFAFGKLHNWGGQGVVRKRIRKPCSRLWRTFTVLADGRVALCCLDYDGQQILGRVDSGHSIRDVWNGQAYREARQSHREGRQADIPLCANCTKAFL